MQLDDGVVRQVCVGAGSNGPGLVDDVVLELLYNKVLGHSSLQSLPHDTVGAVGPHQKVVMHLQCRAPSSSPITAVFALQVLNPADS